MSSWRHTSRAWRRALGLLSVATQAHAQAPAPTVSASASTMAPAAAPTAAPPGCEEKLPAGKARPSFTQAFPGRGLSGHALPLELSIVHGQAETVLPTGFRFQADSAEAKALKQAGFILPDPKGGAGPVFERKEAGANSKSRVTISFVALPEHPGRHQLTLPPLPITMARASGELMTLCTSPHVIVIEDPTANTPNPKPKDNPAPLRQREEWTALKNALGIAAIALVVGALSAWLLGRWLKRPKRVPPPPPPRPPWEVALEALRDLQQAGLTREQRFAELFDRVTDVLRHYLGERYGFDGLESTTREMLGELRRTTPRIPVLAEIERFLRQADLVKFARLTPTEAECVTALSEAATLVERTVPAPMPVTTKPPSSPADETGRDNRQEGEDA